MRWSIRIGLAERRACHALLCAPDAGAPSGTWPVAIPAAFSTTSTGAPASGRSAAATWAPTAPPAPDANARKPAGMADCHEGLHLDSGIRVKAV